MVAAASPRHTTSYCFLGFLGFLGFLVFLVFLGFLLQSARAGVGRLLASILNLWVGLWAKPPRRPFVSPLFLFWNHKTSKTPAIFIMLYFSIAKRSEK